MKQCPRCNKSYVDEHLNFCLDDGELLMQLTDQTRSRAFDDSPPTVMMNDPRVTNPANWQPSPPPVLWQDQSNIQPQYNSQAFSQSKDQVLPTISLVLGILSFVMVCCYGGIWLGLPAAIIGFLGMKNADNDPTRYGGRGLAIGGMVLGVVAFLASIVFLFIGIIAS